MKINEVFNKRLRYSRDGVNAAGDIDAVVAATVSETGTRNKVSSRQRSRIVQRGGKTLVDESSSESKTGGES